MPRQGSFEDVFRNLRDLSSRQAFKNAPVLIGCHCLARQVILHWDRPSLWPALVFAPLLRLCGLFAFLFFTAFIARFQGYRQRRWVKYHQPSWCCNKGESQERIGALSPILLDAHFERTTLSHVELIQIGVFIVATGVVYCCREEERDHSNNHEVQNPLL